MYDMKQDVNKALEIIKAGGIILYPTDTIWGIGCDATNEKAVSRIYRLKQREDSKSMLVLLHTQNLLPSYISEVPDIAWELIEVADRPMTIIYPGAKNLAANIISSDGTIGIRITNDTFCCSLLEKLKKPLVSTSANISGRPSPANFTEIEAEIINGVDYVVTWRQDDLHRSEPSSIIKVGLGGEIKVIR